MLFLLPALGMLLTSCKKELICNCETSSYSNSLARDLNSALNEAIKQGNANCSDVASILRRKGYENVFCTEQ